MTGWGDITQPVPSVVWMALVSSPALQHPRDGEVVAATPLGAAGDTLGTSPCISLWECGRCHLEQGCIPWEWVPVRRIHLCARQEGAVRLELGFQGCRVLGGGWDSGAKLLNPLCSQNLQSLLQHCHSLSHLSLAGTDCPLDAVSTTQGILAVPSVPLHPWAV